MVVFGFFLGVFGVDCFYFGNIGFGVVKFFVGWFMVGIWLLIDWIIIFVGSVYDGDGLLVIEWR